MTGPCLLGLTRLQCAVAACLLDGLTLKQAGAAIGISWRAVDRHVVMMKSKLGVHGRRQLLAVLGRWKGEA